VFHSPVAIGRLVTPTHDLLARDWAVVVLLEGRNESKAAGSWCALLLGFSELRQARKQLT